MALGSTQPLNRNEYREYFLGVKSGRCVGLTTLPPSCADCLEIWEPQPPGTLQGLSGPVMGLLYIFTFKHNGMFCAKTQSIGYFSCCSNAIFLN